MSYRQQVRVALGTFLVFTLAFVVNLFHLQPVPNDRSRRAEPASRSGLETAAIRVDPAAESAGSAPAPAMPDATVTALVTLTRAVERELRSRGYLGDPTDNADILTRSAILAYEWDNGMPLTATPSESLLQSLILGAPAGGTLGASAALPSPAAEDLIRTVQQTLNLLGYTSLKPDGRLGAGTQKALRSFEARQGMPQTGRISVSVVKRLIDLAGKGKLADRR